MIARNPPRRRLAPDDPTFADLIKDYPESSPLRRALLSTFEVMMICEAWIAENEPEATFGELLTMTAIMLDELHRYRELAMAGRDAWLTHR
jgi:hypothetical protein